MMVLEWLRRNDPKLDEHMKTYLFTTLPVTEVEKEVTQGGGGANGGEAQAGEISDGSLGIGSLRQVTK